MFNKETHPNCFNGFEYALKVLDGRIPSSIYIKGAAKRFLNDLKRDDIYFDMDWAEKFMRRFQNFSHVIGVWKTPNIILEPWQCFFLMQMEGFYWTHHNKRKYKEVHAEIARGNAKSTMASVIGLIYLSLYRTIVGNKIYSASTKTDQSRIILDAARVMARKNKSYLNHTGTKVYAHHIAHEESGSEFRALSSDSKSLDGLQPLLSLVDELHAHKTREIYDVLSSAHSKRPDSVMCCITTAGFSLENIGYSQSQYAKKVAIGEIEDEAFLSLVYTLDEDDDWTDPSNWPKANPNWGVSVDIDSFEAKAFKAQNNQQDEVNFKVKHLNLWQNASSQYFDVKKWGALADRSLRIEDFYGEHCYVGIDLASKVDLTSFAYVFKKDDLFYVFVDNFIPKATIENSRNTFYKKWELNGELIVTPGEAINYPKLQEMFVERSRQVKITGAHYDPWNATEFAQRMTNERIEMIEYRMNTSNLSEPMKKLDALIREGRIIHNGNEVLSWCLSNVVAKVDANDNVFPRKEHDSMKIDPIVAMIMAIGGHVADELKTSVYEERGLIHV